MKLELKHLAPYLPYGLQAEVTRSFYPKSVDVRTLLPSDLDKLNAAPNWRLKPILKPMLSLIPSDYGYVNQPSKGRLIDILIDHVKTGYVSQSVFNKMVKNHFDVFGLIDAGLAIDINSL